MDDYQAVVWAIDTGRIYCVDDAHRPSETDLRPDPDEPGEDEGTDAVPSDDTDEPAKPEEE
jgi:hypothetical protein